MDKIVKVVLVIGGSSGIGFETVKIFKKNGYKVYNGSRRICPDRDIDNLLIDIVNRDSIKNAIDTIMQKDKRIDIVVNSAGFSMAAPFEYLKVTDMKYLFDVNFFGVVYVIQEVIPIMKLQGGGRIINISSIGGITAIPYDTFYSCSKAALNMMSIELNLELNKYNIFISSIMPGGTKTDFTFKRKVYEKELTKDYNDDNENASFRLCEIEQNGMSPESVAKTVYKTALRKHPPLLVSSGLMNKTAHIMSRLMPLKLSYKIIKNKFKIE